MARYTQPRKTWQYTTDFKVKAVKLGYQEGIQVKHVAEGLDIHPFMLSRWRKELREDTEVVSTLYALIHTTEAMFIYDKPMDQLLEDGKAGDDSVVRCSKTLKIDPGPLCATRR